MPSSVFVGGMRMSVSTTSGRRSSISRNSASASPHSATSSICGAPRALAQALAHEVAVFAEDDADRHARKHADLPLSTQACTLAPRRAL